MIFTNKRIFNKVVLLIVTFFFVFFFFSTVEAWPDNPENWSCSPYCCDGKDGNGKPRANTAAGEIDNFADACSRSASSECGGSGRYVGCVGSTCYYPQCLNWCTQVLEHEKGYRNPTGSCNEYACNPVYKVCKPKGPVCGNTKVETGEDCDPSGSSCTKDGQTGSCTSTCKCCVRCSVQCPLPLVASVPVNPSHPLGEYSYLDIVSCQDDEVCSEPRDHSLDCYEVPSNQPNVSLSIHPESVSTYLGFNSLNHTGGGIYKTENEELKEDNTVNDFYPYTEARYSDTSKLFYMEATYTDGDLPIESAYVWFNKSENKPITPMYIDLNNNQVPQKYGTQNQEEFGFLVHNNAGVWTPYVPAIAGDGDNSTDLWKKASNGYSEVVDGKTIISIPGPSGIIAKVLLYSITPSNNGKTVTMKFSISFKEDGDTLLANKPSEGNYKIWLMANDTFGFTPYDNYEDEDAIVKNAVHNKWITNERIRYYDQWVDTIKSWNLNFDSPGVHLTYEPEGTSNIEVKWSFTPDPELPSEFNASVINLYKSSDLNIDKVYFNGVEFNLEEIPSDIDTRKIGSLDNNVEKYLIKITSGGGNGSGILSFGTQQIGQGKLHFFITGFDKGGNVGRSGQVDIDLRDWLITQGGLLYSDYIDMNVNRGEEPTEWPLKNLLKKVPHENADISTELVGIKSPGTPTQPSKSEITKSFMIRPFTTPDADPGYYVSLKERYNRRKPYLSIKDLGNISSISGSYGVSETEIAVVERDGDFRVYNDFVCDRQGVFFVSGDLTIEGKITNGNVNKDACIFIVGGTVTVGDGVPFSESQLQYDEVNAYILSDGNISIERDDVDYNGLYISGGIHSLSNPGVEFKRSLKVADRLRFPALVVNHHSKYGILAGRLFGNEILMQQTEVGLKPY